MKTFPVPLLSCHLPLLYAFHFFILVKQDKKKASKQAKKITRSARAFGCFLAVTQYMSNQRMNAENKNKMKVKV